LVTARIPFPRGRYETAGQKRVYFRSVLQKIGALPGVDAVAEVTSLPPYGGPRSEVVVPGRIGTEVLRSNLELCSEGFFRTMGARLLRGRLLSEADVEGARQVVVVNQTLAHQVFGAEDPIGISIKFNPLDQLPDSPKGASFEIIGVIGDIRNDGVQQPVQPEAFLPFTIVGDFGRGILVRTAVDPASLLPSIQHQIWTVDPSVAVALAGTLESFLERDAYAQPRFALLVFGLFASIGLLLAAIGIFSVMAYTVSLQAREIGIRMALGASQGAVMGTILRKGLTLMASRVAAGELLSVILTRWIRNQLWGISPYDPVTLAAVIAVLMVFGVAACIVPARRATRVDPVVALRAE